MIDYKAAIKAAGFEISKPRILINIETLREAGYLSLEDIYPEIANCNAIIPDGWEFCIATDPIPAGAERLYLARGDGYYRKKLKALDEFGDEIPGLAWKQYDIPEDLPYWGYWSPLIKRAF